MLTQQEDQVFPLLCQTSLNVGILAIRKNRNKDLHWDKFTGFLFGNVKLLSSKIDENCIPWIVGQFHRAFANSIFPFEVFQELGITIRILSMGNILLVMIKKGESRIITGFIDPFKILHQLIIPSILDRNVSRKYFVPSW